MVHRADVYVPRDSSVERTVDHLADGFVAFDREWRFLYANRSAEQYLQRKRPELLGRVVWDVFPHLVGTPIEVDYRRAMCAPEPIEFEHLSPLTGSWLAFRAYPSDEGLAIYWRDVTERKRAEDALRASEVRFRTLFEGTLHGAILSKPNGHILAANAAACAMLGRTEEEICLVGRAGICDLSDSRAMPMIEERARTGHARSEVTFVRSDGTRFEIDAVVSGFDDPESGEPRTWILFDDISVRKRTEHALAILAEAGATLAESLDVETTIANLTRLLVPRVADLCIVDVVEGTTIRRLAVACKDPAREPIVAAVKRYAPRLDAAPGGFARTIRTGEPMVVRRVDETWLRAATINEEHYAAAAAIGLWSVLSVPMRAHGHTVGQLALCSVDGGHTYSVADVPFARALADRAALAIDNARQHAAAVEAKRLRDEMLGVVSHDLRNPLGAIVLNAAVLARSGDSPELAAIRRAVARADRLIQDLLTTTVVERGVLALERDPCDVAPIIAEVVELHAPIARSRSVTLEGVAPEEPVRAKLDRHRVVQLLSNLVANAIKFTPSEGRVDVRARVEHERLVIDVADTGCGIAPDEMPRLFDRFWQGARARQAGAGLGLAIAKGIAEAHGGELLVKSEVGVGTTFTFAMPLG